MNLWDFLKVNLFAALSYASREISLEKGRQLRLRRVLIEVDGKNFDSKYIRDDRISQVS